MTKDFGSLGTDEYGRILAEFSEGQKEIFPAILFLENFNYFYFLLNRLSNYPLQDTIHLLNPTVIVWHFAT
jgi:hypothetical protein